MNPKQREELGRLVRDVWVAWAKEQPDPNPYWLVSWEDLNESTREVDRRIGERLYREGYAAGHNDAVYLQFYETWSCETQNTQAEWFYEAQGGSAENE